MTHTKKLLYALLLTLALILMMSVGAAAIGNDAGVAGEGNNAASDTNTSDVTSHATDTDGNIGSDSLNDTTDILDTDRADSEITDGTSNDQTADGNPSGAADSIVNDAAEAATGGFGIWGIIIVILIIAAIVLLIFAFVPKKK